MSDDQPCVTHSLTRVHRADRPRPCYRRGQHFAACQHPDTCRGCVPRTAAVGELCPVCWAKVVDALGRVEELIVHLRSIETAGQTEGNLIPAAYRTIVPESWIMADSLMVTLGASQIPSSASIDDTFRLAHEAVAEWSDVESIVESREGAKRAVVLVKRMQDALTRWPDSEVDWRHVPTILCPRCAQATLYRKGPLEYEDEITIQCAESTLVPYLPGAEDGVDTRAVRQEWELLGYPACEWSMDWFEWLDVYSRPIEAAFALHKKGKVT